MSPQRPAPRAFLWPFPENTIQVMSDTRTDAANPFRPRSGRSARLDPAVVKLIDAIARALALEDDARDRAGQQGAPCVEQERTTHER
jgi:hypothetical protein